MSKTKEKTSKTESQPENRIRIVYRATCPKLTKRGKGDLAYELGVNEGTEEIFVRIAENLEGGSCSFEWVNLSTVEGLLEKRGQDNQAFKASLFSKAFIGRSSNNHGYLAAILKAENVIGSAHEQPTQLAFLSFDGIKGKIISHRKKGADLTDHVAIAQQEREEKKLQRQAERAAAKTKAQKDKPKDKAVNAKSNDKEEKAKPATKKKKSAQTTK